MTDNEPYSAFREAWRGLMLAIRSRIERGEAKCAQLEKRVESLEDRLKRAGIE